MTSGQPLTQQPSPRPSNWAVLVRWRNWRLPVKLAAVTAVPVLLALALGVLTVRTQVERAAVYERSDRLVVLGESVLGLVDGLHGERDASARLLAAPGQDATVLRERHRQVDGALIAMRGSAADLVRPSESIKARLAEADRRIEALEPLRGQVGTAGIGAGAAIDAYGAIVDGLLQVHLVLASDIADAELARAATALHDLAEATDQLYLQQGVVAVGVAGGAITPEARNALRTSHARLADKLGDFRATASAAQLDDYDRTVAGPAVDSRDQQVRALLDGSPPDSAAGWAAGWAAEWEAASGATIAMTRAVADRIAGPLRESSARLQAGASDRAGLASVILFAALVLAAGVGIAVTRQLLVSLGTLRRTALEVADRELPAAVATIRGGGLPDTAARPVPVHTTEDVGELARAFDAVHQQALRLAADETILRTGYSGVFVNLSRRSQGLVQRQLQLLERLERDEEDAEQLATLFQLDHLATRMRRNNENLMVLSGSDLARRSSEPAPLVDLLRAAISEIEHYQRVELRPPPTVAVVGHAGGDLVRLIAELLDNATAFSPPDTPVTVAAHRADTGAVVVNVIDHGIGMSDAEIDEANRRLRDTGPVDLPASRRMGLFVVGRLAGRHGFGVRLHGGKDLQGVQATVTVPAELAVAAGSASQPVAAQPQVPSTPLHPARPPGRGRESQPPGRGRESQPAGWGREIQPAMPEPIAAGELPRRARYVNGSARNGVGVLNGHPQAAEPALGEWPSWWDTTGPPPVAQPPVRGDVHITEETTPIFDQMVSAWFEAPDGVPTDWPSADPDTAVFPAAGAAGAASGVGGVGAAGAASGIGGVGVAGAASAVAGPQEERRPRWESAADGGWLAARTVSTATPTDFTPAGLPKRQPRQSLLPGSIATETQAPAATDRDADDVRGRLSSLRDGITRGRHSVEAPSAGPSTRTDGPLAGPSTRTDAEAPRGESA